MKPLCLIPAYSHIDWRLQKVLETVGIRCLPTYGCSDLVKARSRLLTDGLATDADRFLFLDADVIPTPEDILQLLESPRLSEDSAVSGCYLVREGRLAAVPETNQVRLFSEPRFVPCAAAGLGISVVHRASIERVRASLPTIVDEDTARGPVAWHPYYVPVILEQKEGYRYLADDYSFWWRLNVVGVNLWLDTHVVVGHAKSALLKPSKDAHWEYPKVG